MNSQMKDLDRELELLRMKRKLIQEQWNHIEETKNYPDRWYNNGQGRQSSPYPKQTGQQFRQRGRKRRDWNVDPPIASPKRMRQHNEMHDSNSKKPDYVLRNGVEPGVQLMGRLELGLGSILKQLRAKFSSTPLDIVFHNSDMMKELKTVIRDRIKAAMMGKTVSGLDCVVDAYRKLFPVDTDQSFMETVKRKHDKPPKKSQKVNFKAVKKYIEKKLTNKLDEVFKKVEQIYEEEHKAVKEEAEDSAAEEKTGEEITEEGKVDEVAPQEEAAEVVDEKKVDDEPVDDTNADETKVDDTKVDDNKDDGEKAPEAETKDEVKTEKEGYPPLTEVDEGVLLGLIRANLFTLLPTYKHFMKKILYTDKDFVDFILQGFPEVKENHYRKPTHYVKIMGRPSLPKKIQMEEFLAEFKPVDVKKYKHCHNLLFVGLANEQDYLNLLKENNKQMGMIKLTMRPSNRNPEFKTTKNTNGKEDKGNPNDVSIDSALDNQITDLLTSVKNNEEGEGAINDGEEANEGEEGNITEEAEGNTDEVEAITEGEEKNIAEEQV